ncbi:hypothetical protein HanRHA438_Chr10g0453521 [Helianthus annuus]|nr:hypothetical protein HanRHA438_Chr10g0453521 [Helianthus annuus]
MVKSPRFAKRFTTCWFGSVMVGMETLITKTDPLLSVFRKTTNPPVFYLIRFCRLIQLRVG